MIARQEQMRAHNTQRTPLILAGDQAGWVPPYAYHPPPSEDYNWVPAIALAGPYSHAYPPTVATRYDHPIFPEYHAQVTGVPMVLPIRSDNSFNNQAVDTAHQISMFRQPSWQQEPVIPIFSPFANNASPPASIVINNAFTDTIFETEVNQVHNAMQAIMTNSGKGKQSNKGNGKGKSPPAATTATGNVPRVVQYHGTDTECTLCQFSFTREQPLPNTYVVRLLCNHLFHDGCWTKYTTYDAVENGCPNCRGPAEVKARFIYLGNPDMSQHRRRQPRESSNESNTSFESSISGTQTTGRDHLLYMINAEAHRGNAIPQASAIPTQIEALLDLGALINIGGKTAIDALRDRGASLGRRTQIGNVRPPQEIRGVGQGSHLVTHMVELPVALQNLRGSAHATEDRIKMLMSEAQPNMPLILGAEWMSNQNAVLLLHEDGERLMIPGAGGFRVEWSPGTKEIPMVKTRSGHYAIVLDHFESLNEPTTNSNLERPDGEDSNTDNSNAQPTESGQASSSSSQLYFADVHYEGMTITEL